MGGTGAEARAEAGAEAEGETLDVIGLECALGGSGCGGGVTFDLGGIVGYDLGGM